MDCGIPFCNNGLPAGQPDPRLERPRLPRPLARRDRRLHATNNFPEFTGRLCPAPCESACVLGINQDPVTIKQVEVEIIDRAWDEGWVKPQVPSVRPASGRVIGSGPAGLAAAQQLTAPGTTWWCSSAPTASAACCATASPSSRWRSATSTAASRRWRPRAPSSAPTHRRRRHRHRGAARVVRRDRARRGATAARDLPVPGRELAGIHQAMEYLPLANKVQEGDLPRVSPIDVAGKHVVIIGGGDTGADCLGTAHRQGAASVTQLEIMPQPSVVRGGNNPWPQFAMVYKVTSAHEEGGERLYSVNTERFVDDGNGRVRALLIHEVQMVDGRFQKVEGSDRELPADFVFLAMGFVGPEKGSWLEQLGVSFDERGNVARDGATCRTCRACSWPATWAAGRASSCGRSPRAARAPPVPTNG
jgi:glutamate synthase (NADPH/NADH) small chain